MKILLFLIIWLLSFNVEAVIVTKESTFKDPADDLQVQRIIEALQGRVSFLDTSDGISDGRHSQNMDGEFQRISDTGNVDTEFSVTHTLNRVPKGFLTIKSSKGGVTYDSGTAWTSTIIYLKNSSANNDITIWIF